MNHNPLELRGSVVVRSDPHDLMGELAGHLYRAARQAVIERDTFHLALSGGSTPEPFYMRLVTDPMYRSMPWERTHIWIVDERRVPDDDDRSNYRMIRATLIDHVPTPAGQVHAVPTLDNDPADAYERTMREQFEQVDWPVLDFVLLGMGDDAHTASLFPGSPALGVKGRWFANNDGPQVTPPPRITMTYPLINAAREVAVLVTGAKKADTLRRVDACIRSAGHDVDKLPITGIDPRAGKLTWYLDASAAGDS